AQISRLKIQGIRSFDNQHPEYLNFHTPLTLIVGQNGCGKTTIIECLKYASTGIQPPNSKGGAFIHDPKLTGDKETLGHVKLEFCNTSQNKMVVSRTMSLTTKKGGVTQKTLDCTLLMHNHGERYTMSTRMMDMDKIMPAQLGVTAAVLDNVIFCHQDESLWPMAEPQKLKEKFDKIFDAQKYTKAIDNMIKMRKTHKEELGKLIIHEANSKVMKEKADRSQKRMSSLETEIDVLREKIESYNRDIKAASEVAKEKKIASNKALGTVEELRTKKERANDYQSFLDTLKSDLEELEESDEWLQSTLDKYEERMSHYRQKSQDFSSQHDKLLQAQASSRQMVLEKQSKLGLYQAEQKSHEANIQSRTELIKDIARSLSIDGYFGILEESHAQDFIKYLYKSIQEKDHEIVRIRNSTNDELHSVQEQLLILEKKKTTRAQESFSAKEIISDNIKQIEMKQKEATIINVDERTIAVLDASLGDLRERLGDANIEFEAMDWDGKLKCEVSRLRELELESDRLKSELFDSNRFVKDQAALEYARNQKFSVQNSLEAITEKYNEKFNQFFGHNWQPTSLQTNFHTLYSQRSRALAQAKSEKEDAERKLRDHEFKLKTSKATLLDKNEEMSRCEEIILSSILTSSGEKLQSVADFSEELQAIEQEQNELRQEIGSISIVREYYEKSLKTLHEQSCCRLCERKFLDLKEKVTAEEKLQRMLKKYVEEQAKEELKLLEQDLERAYAARPQYEIYKNLRDVEIPSLNLQIEELEAEKKKFSSDLELKDVEFNKRSQVEREIETLRDPVNSIVKYHSEISTQQKLIQTLSAQQESIGVRVSVDDIQGLLATCDAKARAVREKIDCLNNKQNRARLEISSIEVEVGNLSQKLRSAQHEMDKKQALLLAIEEIRQSTQRQREIILEVDNELKILGPQFAEIRSKHQDVRRDGEEKSKKVQAEKDYLAQSLNKINLFQDVIHKYLQDNGPQKLMTCENEIIGIEQDQKRIDEELIQVTLRANELNSLIADSEKTKRSIVSNIRYRKTFQELTETHEDIAKLEKRMSTENADCLIQEHLAAEKLGQNLMAERGPLVGQMSAKDSELTGLIQEWETDYRDAGQKYREIHIKVEITKATIDDVIKCTHAVDNAIMKYHTLKMEEINSIAGDLWRNTYQGTDIDSIMIRSESENNSTSTKRNYNYRLCMVKQDTELDMRGRCSAGQRVLASIIIRLALAECFGVSCGVIALDEPTTNLDRENITALAESLNRIIRVRKRQSNFQLIIITHDEEFLQAMKCNEFTDIYWHVSRDVHQKSSIKMESLKDS
ncbi:BgTH12-07680, partial [Blumeria graminis f. sp. triticale]